MGWLAGVVASLGCAGVNRQVLTVLVDTSVLPSYYRRR